MYNNKKVSIVVPCHNEAEGIEKILAKKYPFVDEIIIVDNNSTDATGTIARKYGAIVVREKKMGYGQSCQAGILCAKGDTIVILDGDGTYPLSEIENLLSYMKKRSYDFVSGCRYPLVHKNAQPAINRFANYLISWIIRILFKINLNDSQSGMMAFKKDILNKIKIENMGMGFSQEIKIKTFLNPSLKTGETHISYLPRIGKVKFKITDSIKNLYSVLSLFCQRIQKKHDF